MSKREPAQFSQFASFGAYLAKIEGHISFLWSCESSFSFVNDLDVFVRPKKHNMHLENEFRYTFEEKKSFFGIVVVIFFFKIAVKS